MSFFYNMQQLMSNMQYEIYMYKNYMKHATTKFKHETTKVQHEYNLNMQ